MSETALRRPKDHEGQMFVVLDKTPIQDMRTDAVQYYHRASKEMYPIRQEMILDLLSHLHELARGQTERTRRRLYKTFQSDIEFSVMWNLPGDLPREFSKQLINGKMARTLCIDSYGGSHGLVERMESGNQFHLEQNTSVTGFLRSNIKSAAWCIAMSAPERYTTARTTCVWHYARYRTDQTKEVLEYAQLMDQERKENAEHSATMETFLNTHVIPAKRKEALAAFRAAKSYDEQEFSFSGRTLADWGLAHLLDDVRRPTMVFTEQTGVDLQRLPQDNSVRRFMEWFDAYVDQDSLIRPLF